MPQVKKIQVIDSLSGSDVLAEVGDCGRPDCKHRHIDPERFEQIHSSMTRFAPELGLDVAGGREMRNDRSFSARDAQEALFFTISQLAYTEAGLFERYYQPMQYKEFMPVSFEAGEYADVIRYEIYDRVGNAGDLNPMSDDIPTVDVLYADATFPVKHGAVGYEYTTQELRATAFLRRPISERKMQAAVEAYERYVNVIGMLGKTATNITGFLNNANVTHAASPSGLAWSATSGITPLAIVGDFNFGLHQVWSGSNFTTIPDTVALPPAAWEYINSTPATGTTGPFLQSILSYLKENNLAKAHGIDLDIRPCYDAKTAGVSGNNSRTVYYRKTDQDLIFHLPMALRFLAPQLVGLKVKIPGEFRYSGVQVRRTPSMYYQDGN